MKNCKWCKKDFMEKHASQTTCSKECRKELNKSKEYLTCQFAGMNASTGLKGAIQELRVSADLLKKGYYVFRAVSPSCPCDLISMDENGRLKRVEVRSAVKLKGGKFSYSRDGFYDIIAGVFDNEIEYSEVKNGKDK